MFNEFREFIAKGNVMDLAVGVIISRQRVRVLPDQERPPGCISSDTIVQCLSP